MQAIKTLQDLERSMNQRYNPNGVVLVKDAERLPASSTGWDWLPHAASTAA